VRALIDELRSPNRAYAWEVAASLAQVFGVEHGLDAARWYAEIDHAGR
ncbi:MAG: hypothetical protein HY719_12540, partial [Planctomycetes bacterium]|nr:hypothetical protein [Planctomycetota bacterium]